MKRVLTPWGQRPLLVCLLLATAAVMVSPIAAGGCKAVCPLCEHRATVLPSWSCVRSSVNSGSPAPHDAVAVRKCLEQLDSEIIGQPVALTKIKDLLYAKVTHPDRPLILHIAGDNGVGKTHAAHAISRALSFWYHKDGADGSGRAGNAMLVLPTGFDGMELAEVRKNIVKVVTEHLRSFPRGVILIDDVQLLSSEHFGILAPLLGQKGSVFLEAPDVPLAKAVVIMTSDFGRAGVTRKLNATQLQRMSHDALGEAFSHMDVRSVHSIPFLPISLEDAELLLRHQVESTPCRMMFVEKANVTQSAVWAILKHLEETGSQITTRNGRAISQQIIDFEVDKKVGSMEVKLGMGLQLELDAIQVDGKWETTLRVRSRDGHHGDEL